MLIIGAAILVVAVVIVALTGVLGTGKSNANTVSTDSAYTGLRDIIDIGKGQTRILLTLKPGENIFEFESIIGDRTVWGLFSKLENGTRIEFSNSSGCEFTNVDAIKENTIFSQSGRNANNCIVPINEQVIINLPENSKEQEIEIITEKEEEPFIILNPKNFVQEISANPNGKFKLVNSTNSSNTYDTNIDLNLTNVNFTGTLNGNNQIINIKHPSQNYLFNNLDDANIYKLIIQTYNFPPSELNPIYYPRLAKTCIVENNYINSINSQVSGRIPPTYVPDNAKYCIN